MRRANRRRGTIIAFYAAVVVVTGAACALVLARTLEGYASSARMVHRLQAQAAVEGAARLFASSSGTEEGIISVGNCSVEVGAGPGEMTRTMTATVSGPSGREVYRGTWTAAFARRGDESWTLLEVGR